MTIFEYLWSKMGHQCGHIGLLMIFLYIEKSIYPAMPCWPKGSLISESFSISKLMCQITVLKKICSRHWWFRIISGDKSPSEKLSEIKLPLMLFPTARWNIWYAYFVENWRHFFAHILFDEKADVTKAVRGERKIALVITTTEATLSLPSTWFML